MIKFRDRLKELRIERGISQNQLSKKIGISQAAIAKWEKGIIVPTIESATLIAKFFNVSLDYLAGLTND